jgi:hypothetical protein
MIMYAHIQGQEEDGVKMTTAESLAVLLIQNEAFVKQGFSREELGLSAVQADTIAHVFVKYVPDRSVMHTLDRFLLSDGASMVEACWHFAVL